MRYDVPPAVQESIFRHGLLRNTVTVYGVCVSVAVMVLIVYIPGLQVRARGIPGIAAAPHLLRSSSQRAFGLCDTAAAPPLPPPRVQGIFGTASLAGIGWLPQLGTALWLLPFSEWSKSLVRRDPDGWWARHVAW